MDSQATLVTESSTSQEGEIGNSSENIKPDTVGEDFKRLKELICPQTQPDVLVEATMRPDLSDDGVTTHTRTHEVLSRVTSKMQATINKPRTTDDLLESRRRCWQEYTTYSSDRSESVFEGVGAILYDQEWTEATEFPQSIPCVPIIELPTDAADIWDIF
jgi:hypothetical protein